MSLTNIQQAVEEFKSLIEGAILHGGVDKKQAMIRSGRPIHCLHEAVKRDLLEIGASSECIFPPIGMRSPELNIAGFFKQKNQDICLVPDSIEQAIEKLDSGLLQGKIDKYGSNFTEKTISINVRSQISSLAKNFDTLYERTIAEALNLHMRVPQMVLGELYMIPVKEYDDNRMKKNEVNFKSNIINLEKYIKSFQSINNRTNYTREEYKYEKVCLLIVDFEQAPVKIYHTDEELKRDKYIPENSSATLDGLGWKSLIPGLLAIYQERFPGQDHT